MDYFSSQSLVWKKIGWTTYIVRGTVPYVFNSCNLRRTKNCASFGLSNFISEHILYKYLIKKNLQGHLTRYRHFIHFITRIWYTFKHYHQLSKVKWCSLLCIYVKKKNGDSRSARDINLHYPRSVSWFFISSLRQVKWRY